MLLTPRSALVDLKLIVVSAKPTPSVNSSSPRADVTPVTVSSLMLVMPRSLSPVTSRVVRMPELIVATPDTVRKGTVIDSPPISVPSILISPLTSRLPKTVAAPPTARSLVVVKPSVVTPRTSRLVMIPTLMRAVSLMSSVLASMSSRLMSPTRSMLPATVSPPPTNTSVAVRKPTLLTPDTFRAPAFTVSTSAVDRVETPTTLRPAPTVRFVVTPSVPMVPTPVTLMLRASSSSSTMSPVRSNLPSTVRSPPMNTSSVTVRPTPAAVIST